MLTRRSYNIDTNQRHSWQRNCVGIGNIPLVVVMLLASTAQAAEEVVSITSWRLMVYSSGKVVLDKQLDANTDESRKMLEAIEAWHAKSAVGRLDINSYAPQL